MLLRYIATACAFLLLSSSATAQCQYSPALLVMHLVPDSVATIPCGSSPFSCTTPIEASGELNQTYKAYVLLMQWRSVWDNFPRIQDVEIGVDYDGTVGSGVDVLDFQTSCLISTATPIGDWPSPGSQLRMTFSVCVTPDVVDNPDAPLVLGWFRVIAHTPGELTFGISGRQPGYVSRIVTCEQVEKLMDPLNQGVIGLGQYGWGGPCSGVVDTGEDDGPCCFPDHTCQEGWNYVCCLDHGGRPLDYRSTCAQCPTPVLPGTWGRLKARYE
jgi:hypothetical protein